MGAVAGGTRPAAGSAARRVVGELPLLIACLLLLSTAVEILPGDSILGAGPVQVTVSRVLIVVGLVALAVFLLR